MNKLLTVKFIVCLSLAIAFCNSGCFHKDVMNDAADDVDQSFIYTGTGGPYIITKEIVFQATSKSSGGGMTRISGYNECRLTSYDMSTGAMLGRVELGEEMESACEILGFANDKMWCYSIDPELGLHARDPKTMEVVKKEADLAALKGHDLARPEWTQIDQYYAFQHMNGRIILTDMQGVHYYYDPASDAMASTEDEMPEIDYFSDYLGSNAYFTTDTFASFNGSDDRKKLTWNYEDSTAEIPFLKPSFFIDHSELRKTQRIADKQKMLQSEIDRMKKRSDSIVEAHPALAEKDGYVSWSNLTNEERQLRNEIETLKREMEYVQDDLDDLTGPFADHNDYALNDTRYGVLVYSANSVSDTAHAIITCLDAKAKRFTQRWTLDLPSFFFDPDKAEGAGVFDDGDPEFDYRWADVHDGKFVMIAQLRMVCIDMAKGEKLWEIAL